MTNPHGPPSPTSGRSRARVLQVGVVLVALAIVQLGARPDQGDTGVSHGRVLRDLRSSVSPAHQLVNGSGNPIRLHRGRPGRGRVGLCGRGRVRHPAQLRHAVGSIAAMKSWKINSVRLPLNEDCWLGINLPYPSSGGPPTGRPSWPVRGRPQRGRAGGDSRPPLGCAGHVSWQPVGRSWPTRDHSPNFWSSVAATFKGHPGVVFDLFNEPRHLSFACLVHGGCAVNGTKVAGYNQLISDVRDTGATNVIMVAGIDFAANPSGFKTTCPTTRSASWPSRCTSITSMRRKSPATWSKWVRMGLLAKAPFVTGELGKRDCTAKFIDTYMSWADAHGVSYLAWAFNSGPCNGPYLIDANGDPTPYGAGYKAHLAHLAS